MKKSVVFLLHIGFWISFLYTYCFALDLYLFQELEIFKKPSLPFSHFGENMTIDYVGYELGTIIEFLIFCIPPFYLSYFIIKPKLIDKRRLLLLFLFFITIIVLIAAIFITGIKSRTFQPVYTTIILTFVIISFVMGIMLRLLTDYTVLKRQKELLDKHQLNTELKLLKSQLNPHFLFNTLNNIDVLITKDSDKASTYMKKLSDILRFMLYETKDEFIPLNQELDYIEKYIDLQRIRTSNESFVLYSKNGNTDGKFIAPMLFIPFIENAFKHTANKKTTDAIKIKFDITDDSIEFVCENFKNKNAALKKEKSGLGINLIEQRLNLLYKDKHTLQIENSEEKYCITLTIKLNEN